MLVPDGANKVKQFKLPRYLPNLLILIAISCAAFLSWTLKDYRIIKIKTPRLAQLEKEKGQILNLSNRIDHITEKIGEMKEFDHKLKSMVNLKTAEKSTRIKGIGGPTPGVSGLNKNSDSKNTEFVRSMHRSLDNLEEEVSSRLKDKTELYKFLESQKILLASTPSIWPTKGWLSCRFGKRISPFTGEKEFHKGIDIAARKGTPVVATAEGMILYADWKGGLGRTVIIKHAHGLKTRYGHLNKFLVKKGQYVKRGEKIALVGNSGRSTGPHVHYEVHLENVPVDPSRYIVN